MITAKMRYFPLGTVTPLGYLKTQLLLQAENITGDMELYDEFSSNSGWLGGDGESWERGPYYVRGLVSLAYTLKSEELKFKAKKWIDYAVNNQKDDGNFGSKKILSQTFKDKSSNEISDEWWARMPMLMAIRDYYEAELNLGNNDCRILPFFNKYFHFQLDNLKKYPLVGWAQARGADNIDVVLWYRNICLSHGQDVNWLNQLASLLLEQTFDWSKSFRETYTREHVVNTTQGFKYPFYQYLITGDKSCLNALKYGIGRIRNDHGRIDYLPNADEAAKDNGATVGTETCAVVEGMLSFELAGAICADSYIYDLLESYAYNNLPNCFDYNITGYNYFQTENSVMMTHGSHGFCNDHGDSNAIGIGGFECCFSNLHMGYPKFVASMWALENNVLVLTAYGENCIETEISGKKIKFCETTGYPYHDSVRLTYSGEKTELPLKFRVPGWTQNFSVRLNGKICEYEMCDGYALIIKELNPNDVIDIQLKSEAEICDFHNNTMYVKKGAALYCMPIKEDWRRITDFSYRGVKYNAAGHSANWGIYPKEKWNYTFYKNSLLEYTVNNNYDNSLPNTQENSPCSISLKMYEAENWKLNGNNADTVYSASVNSKPIIKHLIPTAFSRLKISLFPKISLISLDMHKTDVEMLNYICRNINNAPVVPTKLDSAFMTAQLTFDIKKEKGYTYYIVFGKKSGEYTDISAQLSQDMYSFSGDPYGERKEKDKYAVSVYENEVCYLRIACLYNGELAEISQEVKFNPVTAD